MKETVLVTGGAGFIGSNLAASLLRDGHRVTVLDSLAQSRQQHVVIGGRHWLTLFNQLGNRAGGLINHSHALPRTHCNLHKFVVDCF